MAIWILSHTEAKAGMNYRRLVNITTAYSSAILHGAMIVMRYQVTITMLAAIGKSVRAVTDNTSLVIVNRKKPHQHRKSQKYNPVTLKAEEFETNRCRMKNNP
jgi:hypothetical protein